ncbi:MAG: type 3 dihydrofolate reductase [Gammaproteobacteria bacterium]|jgi:dihydrofolate reductase
MLTLVVAMAHDRVIGRDNEMPWHLPADLKHFKSITLGKPVVMGRRTYESIGRPLPGRLNIVITRDHGYEAPGCTVVASLDAALAAAGDAQEVMVIGGANLYAQVIERAERMYLTLIDAELEGDTHFPEYDAQAWRVCAREPHSADEKNAYPYEFVTLERV